MPDTYGLGHRPLVRKLSATQNDLFKKFDRSAPTSNDVGSSLSSSGTATPTGLTRSRPGSVKKVRTKAEVSQNTYRKFLYTVDTRYSESGKKFTKSNFFTIL